MNSKCRKPDIVSLELSPNLVDPCGRYRGRKRRRRSTVCKDGDDGAVLCYSEYGTAVGCGITTNFQDEDWNKEGGDWYVQFLPGLSLFAVVWFLRVSLWFPDVFSGLPSLGVLCFSSFSGSFLVVTFLISKILIHYHSSWPSGQGQEKQKEGNKQACL